MRPNNDKLEAIKNAPRPKTKKQVRSFLGLIGYYRKFVPNYAVVACSLTDLTKVFQTKLSGVMNMKGHLIL